MKMGKLILRLCRYVRNVDMQICKKCGYVNTLRVCWFSRMNQNRKISNQVSSSQKTSGSLLRNTWIVQSAKIIEKHKVLVQLLITRFFIHSWEVPRRHVNIGKRSFGQVAKGTALGLQGRPETTTIAIKVHESEPLYCKSNDSLGLQSFRKCYRATVIFQLFAVS